MIRTSTSLALISLLVVGCGGSCPGAADASSAAAEPSTTEMASSSGSGTGSSENAGSEESSGGSADAAEPKGSAGPASSGPPTDTTPEPAFPEDATVAQAVSAVPRGGQRANIEPDVLGEPLQNAALYEPCKVGAQHFKLKVAVWNGHAVGVDVDTSNKALASCISKQIRGVEWRDKVRSLNTVEYSM